MMAKTTAAAFDEFDNITAPSKATRDKVATRRDAVVAVLRKAFPSTSDVRYQSSRIIGSLGRGTASNPVADIDLMTVLEVDQWLWWKKYRWNSTDFLYRVRRSLDSESTVSKIGARGQAIRLFYADKLYVDVAAMVKYNTGGYGIPNGSGSWLTTNPIRHEEYLDERNIKLEGDLKKVVRFARQWNSAHGSCLRSFHLEMLVTRTFGTTFRKLGTNYRTALRTFFNYNHDYLSVRDPARYSGDLSRYLTWAAKSEVRNSLKAARSHADLALAAETGGDHKEAIRQWGIILGNSFPLYG